jgi:hypothetical protein
MIIYIYLSWMIVDKIDIKSNLVSSKMYIVTKYVYVDHR